MVYTLGEAAKATGKSKATISKAIKSGRISAKKLDTGRFAIDPSELHRVYPINVEKEQDSNPLEHSVNNDISGLVRELQARLEAARERISDKEATIYDLQNDRDKWRQQANGLLESHKPKTFFMRLLGN